MALKKAPLGSYIYLGCLCGSGYLVHEQDELREQNALHGLSRDLMNTRTK